MIDFGKLLKKFRTSNSLSQNEFVDIVTNNDNNLVGLDVVTISRWENNVVVPTHRRQIEVFQAASQCYFDIVSNNKSYISSPFKPKLIDKSNVWENIESVQLEQVSHKEIQSKDEKGNIMHCVLYTDHKGIPLGHITYKYISQNDFWMSVNKPNKSSIYSVNTGVCLQISSMFCLSNKILPHMLGIVTQKLLSKKVDTIGFISHNKRSNLRRFLKSIGFQVHNETENCVSLIMTYYGALYNKELFYCSVLVGSQGDLNV